MGTYRSTSFNLHSVSYLDKITHCANLASAFGHHAKCLSGILTSHTVMKDLLLYMAENDTRVGVSRISNLRCQRSGTKAIEVRNSRRQILGLKSKQIQC